MFIIFPKYGNKRLRQSIYTQFGLEINPTIDQNQQAIYINTLDQAHAEKVATQVSKDNPGTEILLSRVQNILITPPGKVKITKLTDTGEILPA